ncbi:histidine-rich glycoprotein [Psammomys obesus]|uniref:histidine-rich glycoprotein n=1 Tax=Psammomys obesus TaxID=48139 RepID=UPI0024531B5E|nr:histidine-rich glycoprotein [Psammomys obesus]
MVDHSPGWFSTMKVLTSALLLVILQGVHALSPTNCNASESTAEKVLDLINKGRRNGYAFQLLRVSDAHLDEVGAATVYYFVLNVKESDCWVLSTKPQDDCLPNRWPSELVIGQCKVIATRYSNESQDLRVNGYNCTTSSVSSALSNTKDSPVLFDFFEDSELYRKQANKALNKYKRENDDFASFRVERVERVIRARGGERTNYYVEFSARNCSTQHFPRYPPVSGFCRAVLSYSVEAADLETPENTDITCEVFNFEDHQNMSVHPSHGHHPHGHHPHRHHIHRDHPHGHHPHGDHPHGHRPPGHHPHGHRPPGHHPHGDHPHGDHPPGHRPHGHHPHGHEFHNYGPCDPPSNSQGQSQRGFGPPHGHSRETGPGKGPFPFHQREIGYIYRLPPLNIGEVLALPEANFPSFSLPNCNNPLQPKIQSFPQTASESCPGKFKMEFPQIYKFFAYVPPK